jgi:hypothetical protein
MNKAVGGSLSWWYQSVQLKQAGRCWCSQQAGSIISKLSKPGTGCEPAMHCQLLTDILKMSHMLYSTYTIKLPDNVYVSGAALTD